MPERAFPVPRRGPGHRRVERRLLGSVAEGALARAPVPVLIAK